MATKLPAPPAPPVAEPAASSSGDFQYDDNVNLNLLREVCKVELLEILDGIRGRKCLVLDLQLGGLLNQIIVEGSKLLKENGVQHFRELKGELGEFVSDSGRDAPDSIVYLVRPDLSMMKVISKQVLACVRAGLRSQFHVYFVPHRTVVCEQMLSDDGALQHIRVGEFRMGLIPFDTDLLSLEMEGVFKQCYVDGDTSPLNAVARALLQVQHLFGVVPSIRSKGAAARKVLQKLFHLRRESEAQGGSKSSSSNLQGGQSGDGATYGAIDTLVILDREVDLISPLVTPLTYEGLIDEIVTIENGRIKLDASVMGDESDDQLPLKMPTIPGMAMPDVPAAEPAAALKRAPGEKVALSLNNSDVIFSEIRDLSIERIGAFLQERAIRIRKSYAKFRDNKDASISEIHDFVKKIPSLTKEYKALNQHINIAELLKQTTDSRGFREQWQGERGMLEGEAYLDQIEDMICADVDRALFYKTLRLLCIQSLTSGGIRSNRYDSIKRLLVQTYGFEQLFTVSNLERAGLLKRKDLVLVETTSVWQSLRQRLRLIDERALNMSKPDDISYVAAGYAPLSARLVQMLASSSWSAMGDIMRLLPGPLLEFTQLERPEELSEAVAREAANDKPLQALAVPAPGPELAGGGPAEGGGKRVMLLFMVGGLTFLEVAALRFLSRDPAYPYTIIMATTKLITGTSMLKSLSHDFKAP